VNVREKLKTYKPVLGPLLAVALIFACLLALSACSTNPSVPLIPPKLPDLPPSLAKIPPPLPSLTSPKPKPPVTPTTVTP
jgi:hypothetical protein